MHIVKLAIYDFFLTINLEYLVTIGNFDGIEYECAHSSKITKRFSYILFRNGLIPIPSRKEADSYRLIPIMSRFNLVMMPSHTDLYQ